MEFFLATSNPMKIEEYRKMGCLYEFRAGPDLKEPDSSAWDIAAYKASSIGLGAVTEDTCLHVEGSPYPPNLIKFTQSKLHDFIGARAICEVALARNHGNYMHVFMGYTEGVIVEPAHSQGFGFDAFFKPEGSDKTLFELDRAGLKQMRGGDGQYFCARTKAFDEMLKGAPHYMIHQNIKNYSGPWQNEDYEPGQETRPLFFSPFSKG